MLSDPVRAQVKPMIRGHSAYLVQDAAADRGSYPARTSANEDGSDEQEEVIWWMRTDEKKKDQEGMESIGWNEQTRESLILVPGEVQHSGSSLEQIVLQPILREEARQEHQYAAFIDTDQSVLLPPAEQANSSPDISRQER